MTGKHPIFRRAAAAYAVLAVAGCQSVPMLPGISPYRIDIQQGNVLTQDMVSKLRPGMTRQQVRFALGTPPITDAFHPDRWDYVYYLNKGGTLAEHRRLVLLFDGDTLKRIEGDVVPAGTGAAGAAPDTSANPTKPGVEPVTTAAPATAAPESKPLPVPPQ